MSSLNPIFSGSSGGGLGVGVVLPPMTISIILNPIFPGFFPLSESEGSCPPLVLMVGLGEGPWEFETESMGVSSGNPGGVGLKS